ncbi:unnamed protein product [Mytilus coruscus]|uniref:Zinc finger PHD-type domain-containing protein n=1 Tax=Mytilus coruscus TaxID=42192 RepID=A0A6J8DR46_MYTCO|nr:unnamed protein product [Mytilus coruscus]
MAETLKLTISSDCKDHREELEDVKNEERSTTRTQEIDINHKQQDKQHYQVDDLQQTEYSYKCSICNDESGNNTIACDECNEWFHYDCLKLTEMEVRKTYSSIPYICELYNNKALFRETITNSNIDIDQQSVSNQPLSTYEKVQQHPLEIEEKKKSNKLCQKTTSNLTSKVHNNVQEMENDRRTPRNELTEKYIEVNTSPKEKESIMMNKQSLHQIEDQTYMKQPLVDTTENSRNIDKQNQKQTAKRTSTKKTTKPKTGIRTDSLCNLTRTV